MESPGYGAPGGPPPLPADRRDRTGGASLTTTYIYLDHIATRADTVDAAVEELLALLPGPQGV